MNKVVNLPQTLTEGYTMKTFLLTDSSELTSSELSTITSTLLKARPDQFVSIRGRWSDTSRSVTLYTVAVIDFPSKGALWHYENVETMREYWVKPMKKLYYGREATLSNGESVVTFSGREVHVSALNTLTVNQYRAGLRFCPTYWPVVRETVNGCTNYYQVGHIPTLAELEEEDRLELERKIAFNMTERRRKEEMEYISAFWSSLASKSEV